MALGDGLKLTVLVDGVAQVRISNVRVNGVANNQAIEVLEGLAGKTPGAKRLNISGTWAVMIGGFEFDVATAVATGSYHTIQVPVGTKSIISTGWFEDFDLSGSVNANTEVAANFIGELNPPE